MKHILCIIVLYYGWSFVYGVPADSKTTLPRPILEIPLEGYKILKQGEVNSKSGAKGNYKIVQNKTNNTLAFVAKVTSISQDTKNHFAEDDLGDVAANIFVEYVGFRCQFQLVAESNFELSREFFHHPVLQMRVKFPDTFEEADIITRLQYSDDTTIIIMMGRPHSGFYNPKGEYRSLYRDYETMRELLKKWMQQANLLEGLLPPF